MKIITAYCQKCAADLDHLVCGTATQPGGIYIDLNDDLQPHDPNETVLLKCVYCNSISLWDIFEDPHTHVKEAIYCLYSDSVSILNQDFATYKLDPKMAITLKDRASQANACYSAKAYLGTVILAGSVIEGVLAEVLDKYHRTADPAKYATKLLNNQNILKDRRYWNLADMVEAAYELRFIDKLLYEQADYMRNSRNYVHPDKYLQTGAGIDKTGANISLVAANGICLRLKPKL